MTRAGGYRCFLVKPEPFGLYPMLHGRQPWHRGVNLFQPCSHNWNTPDLIHPTATLFNGCNCGFHAYFDLTEPALRYMMNKSYWRTKRANAIHEFYGRRERGEVFVFTEQDIDNFYIERANQVIALAAVTGLGRLALHDRGWRASKAEIVAVLSTGKPKLDAQIQAHYDVPLVVSLTLLEAKAAPWGTNHIDELETNPNLAPNQVTPKSSVPWIPPQDQGDDFFASFFS